MISREDTMPTMRAMSSEDKKIRCNLESTKRRACGAINLGRMGLVIQL